MQGWSLHLLNARGQFSDLDDWLQTETLATKDLLEKAAPKLALDVVIRASDYAMPPSLAIAGSALGPGRIELTVDLRRSCSVSELKGQLKRTLIHEYHHATRWEGPGYGKTLGAALVSEGLAQRFVHDVISCPPEPWEIAVPDQDLPALARRANTLYDSSGYSHSDWFFGCSDLPVWAGYALGRAMIDGHLKNMPHETALSLARTSAGDFRNALLDLANGK
ncbi:DUF2268 domain-containing putative Zn-dependent protease [uncultured Ruegeria sp.]|uniref:DUF2268 domain-containing putative Zn-dependent protease n=1 Tax=uncultured Ruegeria sp. TaxID=259304 RepID=UPI0026128453|nr:DUF2268 domain-containing putative Zn-dependent protease [uncultured Ruegeria sp.]